MRTNQHIYDELKPNFYLLIFLMCSNYILFRFFLYTNRKNKK